MNANHRTILMQYLQDAETIGYDISTIEYPSYSSDPIKLCIKIVTSIHGSKYVDYVDEEGNVVYTRWWKEEQ